MKNSEASDQCALCPLNRVRAGLAVRIRKLCAPPEVSRVCGKSASAKTRSSSCSPARPTSSVWSATRASPSAPGWHRGFWLSLYLFRKSLSGTRSLRWFWFVPPAFIYGPIRTGGFFIASSVSRRSRFRLKLRFQPHEQTKPFAILRLVDGQFASAFQSVIFLHSVAVVMPDPAASYLERSPQKFLQFRRAATQRKRLLDHHRFAHSKVTERLKRLARFLRVGVKMHADQIQFRADLLWHKARKKVPDPRPWQQTNRDQRRAVVLTDRIGHAPNPLPRDLLAFATSRVQRDELQEVVATETTPRTPLARRPRSSGREGLIDQILAEHRRTGRALSRDRCPKIRLRRPAPRLVHRVIPLGHIRRPVTREARHVEIQPRCLRQLQHAPELTERGAIRLGRPLHELAELEVDSNDIRAECL